MADLCTETVDPRIRRTRQLFRDALGKLLEEKEFDKISVQDVAEASTLNRATFYDHYTDKFALLDDMVAVRFHELLKRRDIAFDGSCATAMKAMVLAVCDFLLEMPGLACASNRQMEQQLESAVVATVRRMVLEGLKKHAAEGTAPPEAPPEMIAAAVSSAIVGAAKEWLRMPNRPPSEEITATVIAIVSPMFAATYAPQGAETQLGSAL
jgi:AcrR family transcriptional regulator